MQKQENTNPNQESLIIRKRRRKEKGNENTRQRD